MSDTLKPEEIIHNIAANKWLNASHKTKILFCMNVQCYDAYASCHWDNLSVHVQNLWIKEIQEHPKSYIPNT